MRANGDFTEAWLPGEERTSKLVFIGKNLDEAELRASFKECLAPPDFRERKIASLEALRTELGRMIAACEQDTVGDCRIIDALAGTTEP